MGDYIVHYNGSEETGFVVTNITPISITGTKTWVDHSNAYGTRPEDLTLTLYRQIAGGQEETVDIQPQWTKDGDNGNQWTYTYSDLPLTDDAANVYTYWVKETRAVPEGEAGKTGDTYKMTQEGYDFTNTLTGTTEVTGVKTWRDNGKTDRGSIELTLYRNDEIYDTLTLTGEGDAWDYAFEDLPKYDEKGALYVYEVRETDAPEGYDVHYTEEGIMNVQQGGLRMTKTVTGTGGDREKAFSFTVKLDDPAISGAYGDLLSQNGEATVNLSDGESAEASGLPADVAYTVTENGAEADGYTVKSEGAAGEILPGEIGEVHFENHKDAPVSATGDSARTGDDRPVMLYLASALLALLLAAFTLLLRRRLKR